MFPQGAYPGSFRGPPPAGSEPYQAAGPPTAWASTPSYQSTSYQTSSYPALPYDNSYYGNSIQQSYGHSQSGYNYGGHQPAFGHQHQYNNSSQGNPQNNMGVSGFAQTNYSHSQMYSPMGNMNPNNRLVSAGYQHNGTQTSDQRSRKSYNIDAAITPYFDPKRHVKMNQVNTAISAGNHVQSFPQWNVLPPTREQNQTYTKQQNQKDGFSMGFPSKSFHDTKANQIPPVPMSFGNNNRKSQQNFELAQSTNQQSSSTAHRNDTLSISTAANQITRLHAFSLSAAQHRNPVNPIPDQIMNAPTFTKPAVQGILVQHIHQPGQNTAPQQSSVRTSGLTVSRQSNTVTPISAPFSQVTKAPIFTQPTAQREQVRQVQKTTRQQSPAEPPTAQSSQDPQPADTTKQSPHVPIGPTLVSRPLGSMPPQPPPVGLLYPPEVLAWSRPAYSYATLICMAISATPGHEATLKEICQYIEHRFPYYRTAAANWRASIRQNLTVNDCFYKTRRRRGDTGCPWALDPAYSDMFDKGSQLRRGYRYKEGSVRYAKSKEESRKKLERRKMKKVTTQGGSMHAEDSSQGSQAKQTEESQDSQASTDLLMNTSISTTNKLAASDNHDHHQRGAQASITSANNDKHPSNAANKSLKFSNPAPQSHGFGHQPLAPGCDTAHALSMEFQNKSYAHLLACLPVVTPATGNSSQFSVPRSNKSVKDADDAVKAQLDSLCNPPESSEAHVSISLPVQSDSSQACVADSQSGQSESLRTRVSTSHTMPSQDLVHQPYVRGRKTKPKHANIQDIYQRVQIASLNPIADELKPGGPVISIPDKTISRESPRKPPKKNKSGHKNSKNAKRSQKKTSKIVLEGHSATGADTQTANYIAAVQPSTHEEGLLAAGQSSVTSIDTDDKDANAAVGPATIEKLLKNTLGDGYIDPVEAGKHPQGATQAVISTSQTSQTGSNVAKNSSVADTDIATSDNFTLSAMDTVLGCNNGQVKDASSCAQSGTGINGVLDSPNRTVDQDSNKSSLSTSGSDDALHVSNTSDLGTSVLSPASDQQQTKKCATDTDDDRSSSIPLTSDSGDVQTGTSIDSTVSSPGQSESQNAQPGQSDSSKSSSGQSEPPPSVDSHRSNKENSFAPSTPECLSNKNNSVSLFSDVDVYGELDFNDMKMDWDFTMDESTYNYNDSGVNLSLNLV